ncbi:MAG: RNA-binding protein [Acidobacteria bacterium]|nr:MAG: RNA-binding protein [Acidobacteriota bacterium]PYY10642.1 MAG: RNA-binding protein [Acidobacteriota bacterium]
MSSSRRAFLQSLSRSALVLSLEGVFSLARPLRALAQNQKDTPPRTPPAALGVSFVNVAKESGLNAKTIFGGEHKNTYLLETTGCGVAFYDYDNDGWLDIFVVNGSRLEGFPKGQEPTSHLFKNNRDGTFTDVTDQAGLRRSGWGQGVCVGDYDNDGCDDLFVTYYGKNVLYHNNGNGTFTDVSEKAGVAGKKTRWGTGCAFLDYDRDGHLDLFVANYIALDLATAPVPESGPCLYKGVMVACGPPGLPGDTNILYHNNGDGTFTDVSDSAGITGANGFYGLGVLTADFDNDGWPDIYVANDSTASALFQNKKNGKFADVGMEAGCVLSADGKPQAGMGVSAADYDMDGNLDIVKTNFAGDTPSLYRNRGNWNFEDTTFTAGLGMHTQYLGWGCGFFDMDNDGWPDILVANGHVYPEVEQLKTEAGYAQRKLLYKNLRNGHFADVSEIAGSGISTPYASRGCAFGDFDNDGDLDIVVTTINDYPQLIRCDSRLDNNWIKVKTIGTKSNRSGIGARIRCVTRLPGETKPHSQIDEVRSGGSYISQNDLRVHFGIGKAAQVDLVEIRWPSGQIDTLKDLKPNQLIFVEEGKGLVRTKPFSPKTTKA